MKRSNDLTRYVGLGFARLHVSQSPLGTRLGHQFETEDTILGQEHVLREDVHSIDTLRAQTVGHWVGLVSSRSPTARQMQIRRTRVVTVEVLLKWTAKDGFVSVGREGTRKHRYTSGDAFSMMSSALPTSSSTHYPKLLSSGLSKILLI